MAKLKAYTVGTCGFVSREIADAIGLPRHVRQANVTIIAHTKAEALKMADDWRCASVTMSNPEFRVDDSPWADWFIAAANGVPQAFVHAMTGGAGSVVVAVDANGPRRVGTLQRGDARYNLVFVPDQGEANEH